MLCGYTLDSYHSVALWFFLGGGWNCLLMWGWGRGHKTKRGAALPVVVLECGDVKLEQSFDSYSQSHLFLLTSLWNPLLNIQAFYVGALACWGHKTKLAEWKSLTAKRIRLEMFCIFQYWPKATLRSCISYLSFFFFFSWTHKSFSKGVRNRIRLHFRK